MKLTYFLFLLLNCSTGSAQSFLNGNASKNLSLSIKSITGNDDYFNTKTFADTNFFSSNNSQIISTKKIKSDTDFRNTNFNPFKMQSISFTLSEIRFKFQLDIFYTAAFAMQKSNFLTLTNISDK